MLFMVFHCYLLLFIVVQRDVMWKPLMEISNKIPSVKPFKNAPAPAFEASGSLRFSALAAPTPPDTWEGFGEDSDGFFVKLTNGKPSFSREKIQNEETPVIFYIPNMFNYFTLQDETDETYENV